MKSDTHSKHTESNPRTIIVTDDITESHYQGNIRFKFSDNSYAYYDLSAISSINPFFFSAIASQNQVEILLPSYITPNLLMEFLFVVKNGFSDLEECPKENIDKILSLIKISDFFQNENISIQIISEVVMQKVNSENAFEYLKFSFEKLNKLTENNIDCDTVYFDLFYKCLEILGKNVQIFLKNIDKIKQLDKKIIDELIQKCFSSLIFGKFILIENCNTETINSNEIEGENYFETPLEGDETKNYNNNQTYQNNKNVNFISLQKLENVIKFLYEINNSSNFFDLLTSEYMSIFSNETINELNNLPNPTFQVKIPYDFENYYEEYAIDLSINEKSIIFVMFYKKSDDSFNVCIKLGEYQKEENAFDTLQHNSSNDNNNNNNNQKDKIKKADTNVNVNEEKYCFKIFTFLSIVKINNDPSINGAVQTNLKSLSNNKSMHSIFKLTNFKSIFATKINCTSSTHEGIYNPSQHKILIDNDGMLSLKPNTETSFSIYSEDFFSVTIYLKLCFVHSVLASFFLKNYCNLALDKNIFKISKQLLIQVLKNKYLNKRSENDIVIGLLNWLADEINSKEDITELFDVIQWNKVSDDLVFELVMKYSHMITSDDFDKYFINAIVSKFGSHEKQALRIVLGNVFTAMKRVDYNSVFTQMKKNEKFNQVYLSVNSINNSTKGNINTNSNIETKHERDGYPSEDMVDNGVRVKTQVQMLTVSEKKSTLNNSNIVDSKCSSKKAKSSLVDNKNNKKGNNYKQHIPKPTNTNNNNNKDNSQLIDFLIKHSSDNNSRNIKRNTSKHGHSTSLSKNHPKKLSRLQSPSCTNNKENSQICSESVFSSGGDLKSLCGSIQLSSTNKSKKNTMNTTTQTHKRGGSNLIKNNMSISMEIIKKSKYKS